MNRPSIHSFLHKVATAHHRCAFVLLVAAGCVIVTTGRAFAQGSVEAWGLNDHGQLGNGTTTNSNAPVAVTGETSGVTAGVAGGHHSLSVTNGIVRAWGDNEAGELGDGKTDDSTTPVVVSGLGAGVTALAAGTFHSLAIQNGSLYAWGDDDYGQLGFSETTGYYSSTPVVVPGFESGVTFVAAGGVNSLAIKGGVLYAWGADDSGQNGNGRMDSFDPTPAKVINLDSGVTVAAVGAGHCLAIRDGTVYAWGGNLFGQLGNGTTTDSAMPVAVSGLGNGVTAIAAGGVHSLAVLNGNVYAWGSGGAGQLGNGGSGSSSTPIQIDAADLHDITAVAAGDVTSYALSSDGSLWVWGNNVDGQLGIGQANSHPTPQHLLPPSGSVYTAISSDSAGRHVVATLAPTTYSTPAFFSGEASLGNGVYYLAFPNGNYFGYYSFLNDPHYIYHFDLGYEYVFNAADGKGGVYFYDFKSSTFFYTSPVFPFPYLYDFSLNTVLYYYPDPSSAGHYNTNGYRFFYRFDTGQIITK